MKLLHEILFPLIAVLAAFIVGGIVVLLIGDSPIETYRLLIGSAFSWPDGIGYTLFNATPLIFTGLAVAVAFRCGLLNIGAEGQLYMAAFATAWVGIKFGGVFIKTPAGEIVSSPFMNLPGIILLPLCCLAAIIVGAIWGGIPGILKARFGSHEVINTIMLNFIAVALVSYFTQYLLQDSWRPLSCRLRPSVLQRTSADVGSVHSVAARENPIKSGIRFGDPRMRACVHLSLEDEMGLRASRHGR